eukprot:6202489-Pleurochrysis_carterae.AAC.1
MGEESAPAQERACVRACSRTCSCVCLCACVRVCWYVRMHNYRCARERVRASASLMGAYARARVCAYACARMLSAGVLCSHFARFAPAWRARRVLSRALECCLVRSSAVSCA